MSRGGKRKGAGRRVGFKGPVRLKADQARKYVIDKITEEIGPILRAQIEAAKGMWRMETTPDGKVVRLYIEKPDFKTGEYLLNQVIGKAKETVDLNAEGLVINFIKYGSHNDTVPVPAEELPATLPSGDSAI